MRLWRSVLRALGLSDDVRVRISVPGIEVEMIGDPDKVRQMLSVVRAELEKNPKMLNPLRRPKPGRRRSTAPGKARDSQVVLPTELDEMDSPYALPEAVVVPVEDEDVTSDRVRARPQASAPAGVQRLEDLDTELPDDFESATSEETISEMRSSVAEALDGPDAEATAVGPSPADAPSGRPKVV